jgi:HEAT repeat protein
MRARLAASTFVLALATARAQPPPAPPPPLARAGMDLDGDGKPEEARLEPDGTLRVLAGERELGHAALPGKPPFAAAKLERVAIEDRVVLHARAALDRTQSAELVVALAGGKLETLASERTGPVGDGERQVRLALGEAGLVRYQTAQQMHRCDGSDMLFPERWDFSQSRFRPVELEVPDGTRLAASAQPPAGLPKRPLGLFHFRAASTDAQSAAERRADLIAEPRELDDGKPTVWSGGRGDWVAARGTDATLKVTALRFEPGAPSPREVIVMAGAQRFAVALPPHGAGFITFAQPIETACVAVVLAQPGSLAEIGVFTDGEAGGLPALAAQVANGGTQTGGARQVLAMGGADAARALAAVLSGATGSGRLAVLDLLRQLADPSTAGVLAKALEIASADERPLLVAALSQLGEAAEKEMKRLFSDGAQAEEARADAARVLGAVGAVEALCAGAGAGGIRLRRAVIEALSAVDPRRAKKIAAALAAGLDGTQEAIGDLARALGAAAHGTPAQAEAAAVLEKAWARADGFALKLRLLRAAGALADPSLEPLIAREAKDTDEVLRWAAIEAGGKLGAKELLRASAADPDPRVRRSAIAGLGASAPAVAALGRDGWPMVRKQAAEVLQSGCNEPGALAALERAAAGDEKERGADPAEDVRRAALVGVGRCAPLSPAIPRALASPRQPIAVRELAAALEAKSGAPDAAQKLADALKDVLSDPRAQDDGVRWAGLAVACTRAIGRLKDTSTPVLEALGAAANEPMLPPLRAAAMEAIGRLCPERSRNALEKGSHDPDPTVRRRAAEALRTCNRP